MAKADDSFLGVLLAAGMSKLQQGYDASEAAMNEAGEDEAAEGVGAGHQRVEEREPAIGRQIKFVNQAIERIRLMVEGANRAIAHVGERRGERR